MKGRPLRFLVVTLGTWTLGRVAVVAMEEGPLPALVAALAPPATAATRPAAIRPTAIAPEPRRAAVSTTTRIEGSPPPGPAALATVAQASAASPSVSAYTEVPDLPPPLPPTPPAAPPGRWAGSFWGIVRGAGDGGGVPGAQLGGSQAGARFTYAIGDSRRIALAARVSTPLEGRGREAALGVEWRPLDAPVRLLAERRWSLDGGRGGPTVMLVGGLPPTRVGPLTAEGYAQAGAIARGRVDAFADGAARVAAPLPARGFDLDLGVGAWGGAQPGAARLDVGPSLGLRVPIGERRLRLTLDWRHRVAGSARPGSGPALSIGSDF